MKNKNVFLTLLNQEKIDELEFKLKKLGSKNTLTLNTFVNVRFSLSLIVFFMFLFNTYTALISPLLAIFTYILFEMVILDKNIDKRKKKIEEEALVFFETLSLTLENESSLKKSISLTVSITTGELSREFEVFLQDLNYGKSMSESLSKLNDYIPSISVNNIITDLKESFELGTPILETLYKEIDYLKEKTYLEIKSQINKISVKFSIISVLIVVPAIILLILAPILIRYI